jgi:hypothetical protein
MIAFNPDTWGQKQEQKYTSPFPSHKSTFYFDFGFLKSVDSSYVKTFLLENFRNLKHNSGINLQNITESLNTNHYLYEQTHNSFSIYGANIKINYHRETGKILSIFDNTLAVPTELPTDFPNEKNILTHLITDTALYYSRKIYFFNGRDFIPAIELKVANSADDCKEIIMDAKGNVLYQRDLNMYVNSQDSIVKAGVFLPNPIISAQVIYGVPYEDNDNTDVPQLNAEIKTVDMTVRFDNGTFYLESPYAKITEHSAPVTTPATSINGEFILTRSQSGFEDVNAFYHINEYQNYLQSIGLTNLADYQIHIDAHALNGADQSNFSPLFNPPRLNFGTGGVDDAEDAHVIVHEYGHAIMHSAAPNTNTGYERMALDEANCDYIAISYSKAISPYNWHKVFSWDGHNPFWPGRFINSSKKYPQDLSGSYHLSGEIWSSTLMQIHDEIGRYELDKILFQSIYSYAPNMTMNHAAILLIQADDLLNSGKNKDIICHFLKLRGLYNCPVGIESTDGLAGVKIFNSKGFYEGHSELIIEFPGSHSVFHVSIYDATGRFINQSTSDNNKITLRPEDFNLGLYILRVRGQEKAFSIKIIR